jgi:hypothetical protein
MEMNDRISKITHKGKDIIVLDLSGLNPETIVATFPEFNDFVVKERCPRLLIDVSDTHTTPDIKAAGAASDAYLEGKVGKTMKALVGVKGMQRLLANAMVKDQYFASSRQDGLDHLAGMV